MSKHFSHWGEEATLYMDVLAKRSHDEYGKKIIAEFKGYWRKAISVVIQSWNATVILNKVKRLSLHPSIDIFMTLETFSAIYSGMSLAGRYALGREWA